MDSSDSDDREHLKRNRSKTLDTVVKIRQIIHGKKGKTNGKISECTSCTNSEIDELFQGVKEIFRHLPDDDSSTYESGTLLQPEKNINVNNNKNKITWHQNDKKASIFDYQVDNISTYTGKQNLQRVLIQLHDEFDVLNRKYDHLSMLLTKGGYKEVRVELEKLDIELNKKEKEITTILALCKEILNLKNQLVTVHNCPQVLFTDNATSMSFFKSNRQKGSRAIIPYS